VCQGQSGAYDLGHNPGRGWFCSCPVRADDCCHLRALWLITIRRRAPVPRPPVHARPDPRAPTGSGRVELSSVRKTTMTDTTGTTGTTAAALSDEDRMWLARWKVGKQTGEEWLNSKPPADQAHAILIKMLDRGGTSTVFARLLSGTRMAPE
jgi:hypothetical protein